MRVNVCLAACICALVASSSVAADETKVPTEPPRLKRVVHSIEVAVSSKEPFKGAVTLRLIGARESSMLTFYWGGKCKKTSMTSSRLELLRTAMEHGYAVELPSEPLAYNDRIYMCIRSVRVLKE